MPESERQSTAVLAPLLPALGEQLRLRGSPQTSVRGLTYDSRRVEAGDLFIALKGEKTDGALYVAEGSSNGMYTQIAPSTAGDATTRVGTMLSTTDAIITPNYAVDSVAT